MTMPTDRPDEGLRAKLTALSAEMQAEISRISALPKSPHMIPSVTVFRWQRQLDTLLAQASAEPSAPYCPSCHQEMRCDHCYGRPLYDPKFGDNRDCACGHPYYRHFDGYDGSRPVGCKYCGCETWKSPDGAMSAVPLSGAAAPSQAVRNGIAVKLSEMMAAHRDGQDGTDCCDINDPGSCGTCETLKEAITTLSMDAAAPSEDAK